MLEYLSAHWLDITTTILGIIYLVLEYKASIALWIVGIIMPALDVWLYWTHGLYGDAGMAVYYTLAALYGYAVWKFGRKHGQKQSGDMPITRMQRVRMHPLPTKRPILRRTDTPTRTPPTPPSARRSHPLIFPQR